MIKSSNRIVRRLRDCKAWMLRCDRRKQRPTLPPVADVSQHQCNHCGCDYMGRQCPQCGTAANWERFTFKSAVRGFLDIWGLGQRSIFLTMRDLLLRPGYMIRDYLGGHHLNFFPPFKLMAVLLILFSFFAWVSHFPVDIRSKDFIESIQKFANDTSDAPYHSFSLLLSNAITFLDAHDLYRVLLQNIMVTLAVWFVFRKKSQYNMTETFIAQIYINSQFLMLAFLCSMLTFKIISTGLFPYAVFSWLVPVVLVYDYRQLYGLKLWSTIWRTLLITLIMVALYALLVILLIVLFATITAFAETT